MIGKRIGGTARAARHHDGRGLSIDGLSRDLQVSPTPVRETLFPFHLSRQRRMCRQLLRVRRPS
jgi:hypothetical protein